MPCVRRDGSVVYVELSSVSAPFEGAPAIVAVGGDATAQMEIESVTRDALALKDTMLKEIHHRVKNNLQVISSLLSLQSDRVDDDGVRAVFDDMGARVHAIAMLHERLY